MLAILESPLWFRSFCLLHARPSLAGTYFDRSFFCRAVALRPKLSAERLRKLEANPLQHSKRLLFKPTCIFL